MTSLHPAATQEPAPRHLVEHKRSSTLITQGFRAAGANVHFLLSNDNTLCPGNPAFEEELLLGHKEQVCKGRTSVITEQVEGSALSARSVTAASAPLTHTQRRGDPRAPRK